MKRRQRVAAAIIVAVSTVTIPTTAVSAAGWYIGVGAGDSEVDDKDIDDNMGIKLFVGYNLSEKFAVEGGFIDLGKFDARDSTVASVDVEGVQVVAVADVPITEKFSLLGKAGVYLCDADKTLVGISESERGTLPLFGIGIEYGKTLAIRSEWDHIHADGEPINLFSVSVVFRRRTR